MPGDLVHLRGLFIDPQMKRTRLPTVTPPRPTGSERSATNTIAAKPAATPASQVAGPSTKIIAARSASFT
jgi:hypothetical protein